MRFLALSKADLLRMLASLLLGTLLGTALATVLSGRYIDQLILANKDLSQQLTEEQARVKQFEKVYSWTPVVQKVELKLTCTADKYTEQELEKKIRSLLTGLIGLPIQQIDNTILREILHNRAVPVADDTFDLQVNTIIVDEDLVFFVEAKKHQKKVLEDE